MSLLWNPHYLQHLSERTLMTVFFKHILQLAFFVVLFRLHNILTYNLFGIIILLFFTIFFAGSTVLRMNIEEVSFLSKNNIQFFARPFSVFVRSSLRFLQEKEIFT